MKQVTQIVDRALELSGDDFHVFFEYSAHVNLFSVRIFNNGWQRDNTDADIKEEIYLERPEAEEELKRILNSIEEAYAIHSSKEVQDV